MTDNKEVSEKHLEFIQAAITRMGQNSFQAKAWGITIVSALIAFFLSQEDVVLQKTSIFICIAVLVLFCLLDTYYLFLERGFRGLYKAVANLEEISPAIREYDMTIPKKYRRIRDYLKALISLTTGLFYGVMIVLLVLLMNYII